MEILESKYYMTRSDGVRIFVVDPQNGHKIQKVGTEEVYTPPTYDVEDSGNQYVTTDIPIETEPETDIKLSDALGYLKELGVDVDDQ